MDLRYYLSIFLRRLPWFVLIAGLISGLAITVAMTLPPLYVSQARLIVETSQIPGELAAPTVQLPPEEQLQIFETRLLTRANLLAIANRVNVFPDQSGMTPDEIVGAMRAQTSIWRSAGRNQATLMTLVFESQDARTASAVVNEYLTLILQEDTEFRTQRATQTQEFFEQEVAQLSEELDRHSARILEFENANADALPNSLQFRLGQQITLQDRLGQTERQIAALTDQRARLVQVYETTGQLGPGNQAALSPEEAKLQSLQTQLDDALVIYSEENPRVKLLQARVAQQEKIVLAAQQANTATTQSQAPVEPGRAMLDAQLAGIDSQIAVLQDQKVLVEEQLARLEDSIARTPANTITLDALNRDYANIQLQYNTAVDRLAQASTGERIELLSRGQRVTVVDQPTVPNSPSKPNRKMIAGGGVAAGLGAGLALIVLLEVLNGTARRPVDLVSRLGVTPIATIPYLRTRREQMVRRAGLIAAVLAALIVVPAAIYAVHTYYQPLDLIAEKIMSKLSLKG